MTRIKRKRPQTTYKYRKRKKESRIGRKVPFQSGEQNEYPTKRVLRRKTSADTTNNINNLFACK